MKRKKTLSTCLENPSGDKKTMLELLEEKDRQHDLKRKKIKETNLDRWFEIITGEKLSK